MKKLMSILGLLTIVAINILEAQNLSKKLWTLSQVKEMAKSYNFQGEISETKNNGLLYLTKEQLIEYFNEESKTRKNIAEFEIFIQKTKYVTTVEDYYRLINSIPSVREDFVKKIFKSEQKFISNYEKAMKLKWRIYRNNKGEMSFYEADKPVGSEEHMKGTRQDKLSKF
jgi:hypothetical protein